MTAVRSQRSMSRGGAGVVLGFVAFGFFWGSWGAIVPSIQRQAQVTDGQLGSALLMIGVGALVSMRLTGAAMDRFGHRTTAPTVALLALASLPLLRAGSHAALIGALLFVGFASGAMDVAINGAGVEEEALTGPLMSLAHASFSGAVVVSSLLAGAALGLGASSGAVLSYVAVVLVAAAVGIVRLRRGRPEAAPAPDRPSDARCGNGLRLPPVLLMLGGLCAIAYLVENAWQSWGAVHLVTTFGQGPTIGSLAPAFFAGSAMLGRLGSQRLLRRGRALEGLVAAGAAIAAVGTATAALAPNAAAALVGIVVAGVGTSVCAPSIISLAGRHSSPARRAGAVSVVTSVGYLGFLVGPAIVGLVASLVTLRVAFLLIGAFAVVMAAATLAARPVLARPGKTGVTTAPAES